mmetsp:Transcript_56624/g.120234  ORF Transcript_56624/g.120234 Transcript_56624/m.120234 type:complete len:392 (+) Transcript_56624:965-2140(+)
MGPDISGRGHPARDGRGDVPAEARAGAALPLHREEGHVRRRELQPHALPRRRPVPGVGDVPRGAQVEDRHGARRQGQEDQVQIAGGAAAPGGAGRLASEGHPRSGRPQDAAEGNNPVADEGDRARPGEGPLQGGARTAGVLRARPVARQLGRPAVPRPLPEAQARNQGLHPIAVDRAPPQAGGGTPAAVRVVQGARPVEHAPGPAQLRLRHGEAGPGAQDRHEAAAPDGRVGGGAHPAAEDHPEGVGRRGLAPDHLGRGRATADTPFPGVAGGHPRKPAGPAGSRDRQGRARGGVRGRRVHVLRADHERCQDVGIAQMVDEGSQQSQKNGQEDEGGRRGCERKMRNEVLVLAGTVSENQHCTILRCIWHKSLMWQDTELGNLELDSVAFHG